MICNDILKLLWELPRDIENKNLPRNQDRMKNVAYLDTEKVVALDDWP